MPPGGHLADSGFFAACQRVRLSRLGSEARQAALYWPPALVCVSSACRDAFYPSGMSSRQYFFLLTDSGREVFSEQERYDFPAPREQAGLPRVLEHGQAVPPGTYCLWLGLLGGVLSDCGDPRGRGCRISPVPHSGFVQNLHGGQKGSWRDPSRSRCQTCGSHLFRGDLD